MICGVDEAGRGPVIGPLVVAGISVDSDEPLKKLGVRDSKKLSPIRREELELKIKEITEFDIVVLPAAEIDLLREEMTLNRIEAKLFASVIEHLKPSTAYVDSADADEKRFGDLILRELVEKPLIVSKHKADEEYPVVSAASIVAKVRRDYEVKKIENEIGEAIGSGYPSDPTTIAFIERWLREKGELPPHTRSSWRTIINIRKRICGPNGVKLREPRFKRLEDWR